MDSNVVSGPPVTQPAAAAAEKKAGEITRIADGDQPAGPEGENFEKDTEENSAKDEGTDKKQRPGNRKKEHLYSLDEDPEEESAHTEAQDPNWRWPVYDQVYDPLEGGLKYAKRDDVTKSTAETQGSPFQVVYRREQDVALWPDVVQIKINSPHLKLILSKYMPGIRSLRYEDKPLLDGRSVYLILDKLKNHQFSRVDDDVPMAAISQNGVSTGKASSTPLDQNGVCRRDDSNSSEIVHSEEKKPEGGQEEAQLHLNHLVRFLEQDYKSVGQKYQHMKEFKSVSFDMLWTFLTPGTVVVYQCNFTQEPLCGIVSSNRYQFNACGKVLNVVLTVWDYNGTAYRKCQTMRSISDYVGEQPFDSVGVRPIDITSSNRPVEALKEEFMAKGRKFQQMVMQSSNKFMQYTGVIFMFRNNEVVKERADGRIMIDLKSFSMMNPDFPMGNAQPPAFQPEEDSERMDACEMAEHMWLMRRRMPYTADETNLGISAEPQSKELEEEKLMFAPAVVYGFSFALKLWGVFAVTGFSEIVFDTNAFEALVMEPEIKGLLYSLVSQYISTSAVGQSTDEMPRVDPIANKGEGCIFLCYGPPGTGKTLTAESLAENLRRPLWALSVAELGTTPSELEKTLLKILEIAAMWKAVLLLDEADVYLEKRTASVEMTRNAMTGVFIRLLEYHRGVLFLTTNRITTFDDAFRSRISLTMCYPQLNEERREQIWRTSLARVQQGRPGKEEVVVGPDFVTEMARRELNGREIRNAIHTAQTLARSKNEEMREEHLRFVMRVITQTSAILDAVLQGS